MGCGCVLRSVKAEVLSAQRGPSHTERGVEGTKTHRAETSHHMATACLLRETQIWWTAPSLGHFIYSIHALKIIIIIIILN